MLTRQRAQGLAEYALILALIAIIAVVALLFLGGVIKTIFGNGRRESPVSDSQLDSCGWVVTLETRIVRLSFAPSRPLRLATGEPTPGSHRRAA